MKWNTLEDTTRRRFGSFGKDKSGEISLEELKNCIQNINGLVTTDEAETMLQAYDADKNGSVSFDEFLAMMPMIPVAQTELDKIPTVSADEVKVVA